MNIYLVIIIALGVFWTMFGKIILEEFYNAMEDYFRYKIDKHNRNKNENNRTNRKKR